MGFIGTAYITLAILVVFYLIGFEPATAGKANPIDLRFLTAFRRVLKKIYRNLFSKDWVTPSQEHFQEWQNALNQVRYMKPALMIPFPVMLTIQSSVCSL